MTNDRQKLIAEAQKAVWAEIHGQDPQRMYSVAEVKKLVYSLDNAIADALTLSAVPVEGDREALAGDWAKYRKDVQPNREHLAREHVAFKAGWIMRDREAPEYQPSELATALERGSDWLHDNVHKSRGCIGCDLCTIRTMMEYAADALSAVPVEGEHGPDWSDWGTDHPEEGPSCKCGYNGSPEECAASRSPLPVEGEVECKHKNTHMRGWTQVCDDCGLGRKR